MLRGRLFNLERQRGPLRQEPQTGRDQVVVALHHFVGTVQAPNFFRRFLFSNLMIASTFTVV